jgi:sirohydrochlorin ferrochelatase
MQLQTFLQLLTSAAAHMQTRMLPALHASRTRSWSAEQHGRHLVRHPAYARH